MNVQNLLITNFEVYKLFNHKIYFIPTQQIILLSQSHQ